MLLIEGLLSAHQRCSFMLIQVIRLNWSKVTKRVFGLKWPMSLTLVRENYQLLYTLLCTMLITVPPLKNYTATMNGVQRWGSCNNSESNTTTSTNILGYFLWIGFQEKLDCLCNFHYFLASGSKNQCAQRTHKECVHKGGIPFQ